jgi:hypothetical protein
MSVLSPSPSRNGHRDPLEHEGFLPLLPLVQRHASVTFRGLPASHREEAVAEAVAAAFTAYLALKACGKDPVRDFPTRMAVFAVLHVKSDRHVGSKSSSKDVLSFKAQHKHGFQVEPLPGCTRRSLHDLYGAVHGQQELDTLEEQLQDNVQSPVPEQAAFRIDFPMFLETLSQRDREMVHFLALGNSGKETARRFKVSQGRVTQLRKRWCQEWHAMHGEESPV